MTLNSGTNANVGANTANVLLTAAHADVSVRQDHSRRVGNRGGEVCTDCQDRHVFSCSRCAGSMGTFFELASHVPEHPQHGSDSDRALCASCHRHGSAERVICSQKKRCRRGWLRTEGACMNRNCSLPSAGHLPLVGRSACFCPGKVLHHGKRQRTEQWGRDTRRPESGQGLRTTVQPGGAGLYDAEERQIPKWLNFPRISECTSAGTMEIYPESAVTSDKDKKLGEYCLVEK